MKEPFAKSWFRITGKCPADPPVVAVEGSGVLIGHSHGCGVDRTTATQTVQERKRLRRLLLVLPILPVACQPSPVQALPPSARSLFNTAGPQVPAA